MTIPILFQGVSADQISPDEALHGHTADASAITTTTEITGLETLHGHTADATYLIQTFVAPNEALHAQAADATSIIKIISPVDTLHSQTADAATNSSPNIISPAETRHLQTADATGVTGNVSGDVTVSMVKPSTKTRLIKPTVTADRVIEQFDMEVV